MSRFRVDVVAQSPSGFKLAIMEGPHAVGWIGVAEIGNVVRVRNLHVDEDKRGRRLGTKLYEAAARKACKVFGKPLASDDIRSAGAEGFWGKQVRKGRARCVDARGGEGFDPETGRPTGKPLACRIFALTCPAPKNLGRGRR